MTRITLLTSLCLLPAALGAAEPTAGLPRPARAVHRGARGGRLLDAAAGDEPRDHGAVRFPEVRRDRTHRQLRQGRQADAGPVPRHALRRLGRVQGDRRRGLHAGPAPRSGTGQVPGRPDRQDRRGPGTGRLPVHGPHDRPQVPRGFLRPQTLVESGRQPRTVQRGPHVRGGRRPFPGHRQTLAAGRGPEERRPDLPDVRPRRGPTARNRPDTRKSRSAWSSCTASPATASIWIRPSSSWTPAGVPKAIACGARASRTTSRSSSRTRPSATPSGPATCTPAWPTWPR